LGDPELQELQYDADAGRFHARLVGGHGGLNENIIIPVPIEEARAFKENAAKGEPVCRT
jgi:hypothetical protein